MENIFVKDSVENPNMISNKTESYADNVADFYVDEIMNFYMSEVEKKLKEVVEPDLNNLDDYNIIQTFAGNQLVDKDNNFVLYWSNPKVELNPSTKQYFVSFIINNEKKVAKLFKEDM